MIKCKICDKLYKNLVGLSSHLTQIHHIKPKEYYDQNFMKLKEDTCFYNNCKETGINSFISMSQGYHKYCSVICATNSKETREKTRQTYLKRYGVDNPSKSKTIQDKFKKTCLKKYGVDNPMKNKDIVKTVENNNLKKYGVKWLLLTDDVKSKSKQTMLKKYGVDNPMKNKKIKEKSKQTCLERYGVNSYSKTKLFKEKYKSTMLERHGVEHALQVEEFKEKSKQTCLKRYGTEIASSSEIIKNRIIKNNLKKYNKHHVLQVKEIKDKIKKTRQNNFYNMLINSNRLKNLVTPLFELLIFKGVKNSYFWKCNKCETEFEDNLDNGKVPRCPTCYPILAKNTSIGEQEVLEFVKQYYPSVENPNKTILNGKHIDIYIPEIKLGIEYHGLYWHSESIILNKNYHQEKHLLAKEKNVQLIQIFEDEWIEKQNIIKSILLNKMGKSPNKVFARKCKIKEVSNKEAKQFLFDNHLQSEINGTHMGLYFESELVSMITMGKSRFNKKYDYEILRFCNKLNYSITGGLSRLLSHFKKLNPNSSIITYADARYGTGSGYENCGFEYKELTNPNYFYLKNNGRENRIGYQKHKLENLLESFDSTLTEWQNMQLNGFDRIWDAGNYVYNIGVNPCH